VTFLFLKKTPQEFYEELVSQNIKRGFIGFDNKKKEIYSSGGIFKEIGTWMLNDKRDFFEHEATFFEYNEKTNSLFGAFIQKTKRGAGHGGVRLWPYENVESFLREGLRLSLGMGRKNSLAGLWWGGGKGLIAKIDGIDYSNNNFRDLLFGEYGKFVTSLKGCYYGAEDVGLTTDDTLRMFKNSRFITCIPKEVGGSGNPSPLTAKGTLCGMEAVLSLKNESLKGKKNYSSRCWKCCKFFNFRIIKKRCWFNYCN